VTSEDMNIFQGPPGVEENINSELAMLIALCVVVIGLLLTFAGRVVWRHVMSFIGAVIGGLFGFVFGTAVGGPLVGLVVGMLCAIVGSVLFVFLMELALGVVAGFLTYIVVEAVFGSVLISLVLGGIAFVMTIIFIKEAIGVVTAVVGGLLVGIGLLWLDVVDISIAVITMLACMVFGSAFQLSVIREEEERRAAATAVAGVASPVAPPGPPSRTCKKCGGPLTFIPEYGRHYCYACQKYD
jgi:hypothetical protein